MKPRITLRLLLVLTGAIGILLQCHYQGQLPSSVASNFGAGGRPNAYMPGEWNLTISVSGYLFTTLLFLAVPGLMRFQRKWVGFPNQTYWLAPARKAQTLQTLAGWIHFYGIMTNLFLLAVTRLVYLANLSAPVRLDEGRFMVLLSGYFLITVLWLLFLYRHFWRRPPASD